MSHVSYTLIVSISRAFDAFNRSMRFAAGRAIQLKRRRVFCCFSINESALLAPRMIDRALGKRNEQRESEREREEGEKSARSVRPTETIKVNAQYEILPTRAVADLARFGTATRADGSIVALARASCGGRRCPR